MKEEQISSILFEIDDDETMISACPNGGIDPRCKVRLGQTVVGLRCFYSSLWFRTPILIYSVTLLKILPFLRK
jgi:hypothetical protein